MPQPENLQEQPGCAIEQRSPQFLGPADDSHEVAIDQLAEDFAALDAADRFDLGP